MSGGENEEHSPLGTGSALENGCNTLAEQPSPHTPNIAGISGPGEGEGLVADTTAAVAFLMDWCPGGPWVLTAIEVDPPNKEDARTQTATLTTPEAVVEWVNKRSGGRWNIYFTVNRTFRAMNIKPKKLHLAAAVGLHVDVDPRVGEDC